MEELEHEQIEAKNAKINVANAKQGELVNDWV
jgi:hypothetical protein